jgi:hypothetical protein
LEVVVTAEGASSADRSACEAWYAIGTDTAAVTVDDGTSASSTRSEIAPR